MVLKSSCWVVVTLNSNFTGSVTKKMALPKTQTVLSAVSRWTNWLNLFPWPTVQTQGWCAKSLARSWMRTTHPWCCLMAMFMDTMWVLKLFLCSALLYSVCILPVYAILNSIYFLYIYIVITFLCFWFSVSLVHSSRWQGGMSQDQRGFQLFPGWEGLHNVRRALHKFWDIRLRHHCRLGEYHIDAICQRASILQLLFHASESHWQYVLVLNWPARPSLNWWFKITIAKRTIVTRDFFFVDGF